MHQAVLLILTLLGCDGLGTTPEPPVTRETDPHTDGEVAGVACDLHVDPSADFGGSGGATRPFHLLGEAVDASVPGDVICIAPGRLDDPGVTVSHPLELLGAGRDETLLPFDVLVTSTDAAGTVRVSGVDVLTVAWPGGSPDHPSRIVVEDARLDRIGVSSPGSHVYEVRRTEITGEVVFSHADGASEHVLEDVVIGDGLRIVHGSGPTTNRIERATIAGSLIIATGGGASHQVLDSTFHGLMDTSGACHTLIRGNHLPTGSIEDTSGGAGDGETEDHVYEGNVLDAGSIVVRSPNVTLRGNEVHVFEGAAGILVQTGPPTHLVDNVVVVDPDATTTTGIVARSAAGSIRGNHVTGGDVGLFDRSGASEVADNVVVGARIGIDAGGAALYEGNTVQDCDEAGIVVRSAGPFLGHTVTGCGGPGILLLEPADLGSAVGGNTLTGNADGLDLVVAIPPGEGMLLARGNTWDHDTVEAVHADDVWDGRDDPALATVVVDPLGR